MSGRVFPTIPASYAGDSPSSASPSPATNRLSQSNCRCPSRASHSPKVGRPTFSFLLPHIRRPRAQSHEGPLSRDFCVDGSLTYNCQQPQTARPRFGTSPPSDPQQLNMRRRGRLHRFREWITAAVPAPLQTKRRLSLAATPLPAYRRPPRPHVPFGAEDSAYTCNGDAAPNKPGSGSTSCSSTYFVSPQLPRLAAAAPMTFPGIGAESSPSPCCSEYCGRPTYKTCAGRRLSCPVEPTYAPTALHEALDDENELLCGFDRSPRYASAAGPQALREQDSGLLEDYSPDASFWFPRYRNTDLVYPPCAVESIAPPSLAFMDLRGDLRAAAISLSSGKECSGIVADRPRHVHTPTLRGAALTISTHQRVLPFDQVVV